MSKRAVLISTYELGHQPFGLASPAAWLRREGIDTRLIDLAKDKLDGSAVQNAGLVAFHLPMHTATRLAAPVIKKVRSANSTARICAYGLYAPLNEGWLRSLGVDDVLGGEFEEELAAIAREACGSSLANARGAPPPRVVAPRRTLSVAAGADSPSSTFDSAQVDPERAEGSRGPQALALPRLRFIQPERAGLPPLARYATLRLGDGTRRVVGYTEASRGCRHLCRHCPVVPIYNGQFRVVQPDVVLADVDALVASGAEHITFGDPDFFNGPTHAIRIVEAVHARHPAVSYDVTIKIEHLLRHRELMPPLGETGCLFITSAVESLDDRVLGLLEKGHSRQDFFEAVALTRDAGVILAPTFVAFHPWTTIDGYHDLLSVLADCDLVEHVAPIQLAIRLLIPEGSRLLELEDVRRLAGKFDPTTLTYRWEHADARIDELQREVAAVVGRRLVTERRAVFNEIAELVHQWTGRERIRLRPAGHVPPVPHLDEPWYCCAEPNAEQLTLV